METHIEVRFFITPELAKSLYKSTDPPKKQSFSDVFDERGEAPVPGLGAHLRLRNGQGSGMIKLVWKVSPPKGAALRLGNFNPFVGSVSGARGDATALPALSDQV